MSNALTTVPIPTTNISLGKSRNWMFTLNNHSSIDVPRTLEGCKYCIWQEEAGSVNGTKHLQGYASFSGPKTLASLKKAFPTAHWEMRRGTHEQARDYCSKEETRISGPWSYGEEPQSPGTRNDLVSLKRSLDEDLPEAQVWEEHFGIMLKYHKAAKEYKRVRSMENPRTEKTVCIVIFGPTGTGKTHSISSFDDKAYWITKPPKGTPLWMDGYDGHRTVVIDEFYGWIPYDTLLRLTDAYPLQLPIKGGHVGFNPRTIIFTSNKPPEQWYNYSNFAGGYDPLKRRLEYVIEKRDFDTYTIWQQPNGQVSPNLKAPIDFTFGESLRRL